MRIHRLYADKNGDSHFKDVEVEYAETTRAGRLSKLIPIRNFYDRGIPKELSEDPSNFPTLIQAYRSASGEKSSRWQINSAAYDSARNRRCSSASLVYRRPREYSAGQWTKYSGGALPTWKIFFVSFATFARGSTFGLASATGVSFGRNVAI